MRHDRVLLPKVLLVCAAGLIAASAVLGGKSQGLAGGLLIGGGVLLSVAGTAGVAEIYAPSEMPTKNVRLIKVTTVLLGAFLVLAGVALLLTQR